ncbi:MAG: imidazole glycerol phosphate synthase subunit HisH [Polyangiaceae bacterium]
MRIAVCDVGLGNLRSVERALLEASRGRRESIEVTTDPARVARADRVVVPGQAAFRDCVRALGGGMGEVITSHIRSERPYLGICIGLQVLFGSSEEAPGCGGLGVLEGSVLRLRGGVDPLTQQPLKIPHIGWNSVEPTSGASGPPLLSGPQHFYFVHSFVVVPHDPSVIAATTEYGERFASAVSYGNVFASQFHPEKSQRAGLALLERFLAS